MQNEKKTKCKKCNNMIDMYDTFSGGICLECYEKQFNSLSEEEKKPIFSSNLIN